jgi:hypothetical protein
MNPIVRGIMAIYNFLVGDLRILIGTLVSLLIAGLVAGVSPMWAGPLLFVLLSLTLALSLRREIEP